MRILITGSRKWTSPPQVEVALLTASAPDRRRGSAPVTDRMRRAALASIPVRVVEAS